jgi:hypothetical protein
LGLGLGRRGLCKKGRAKRFFFLASILLFFFASLLFFACCLFLISFDRMACVRMCGACVRVRVCVYLCAFAAPVLYHSPIISLPLFFAFVLLLLLFLSFGFCWCCRVVHVILGLPPSPPSTSNLQPLLLLPLFEGVTHTQTHTLPPSFPPSSPRVLPTLPSFCLFI